VKLVNTSEGSSRYGKVVRTGNSGLEPELEGQRSMSEPPGSMSEPPGSLNCVFRLELHEWCLVHLILNMEGWSRSIMGSGLLFMI
jgi:hypothetical protein